MIAGIAVDTRHDNGGLDRILAAFDRRVSPTTAGRLIDELAGRFVAVVETTDGVFATQDGLGTKQLFWDAESQHAATAPGLILELSGRPLRPTPELDRLWSQPWFVEREYAIGGVFCPFTGARRVLANSWLHLDSGLVRPRTVRRTGPPSTPAEVARQFTRILRGLGTQYGADLQLGLSGGRDSRLVLAAALNADVPFETYSYRVANVEPSADCLVAATTAEALGVKHEIRDLPEALSPAVHAALQREQCRGRSMTKINELEERHRFRPSTTTMYLNGNGGEFFRDDYLGLAGSIMAPYYIRRLERESDPYLQSLFDEWWQHSYASRRDEFRRLDQWYWEQRMGVWGGLGFSEHDVVSDQVSPFSSRSMIIDGLNRRAHLWQRRDRFHRDLIRCLWPSLDSFPYIDQSETTARWLVRRPAVMKVIGRVLDGTLGLEILKVKH